jgi:4-hydroxymandelate oxidase
MLMHSLLVAPQLYALAVAGAVGVGHMLHIIREELEVTMALAGTPAIDDITSGSLWRN